MTILLFFRRSSSGARWYGLVVMWAFVISFTLRARCEAQTNVPTPAPAPPTFPSDPTVSAAPAPAGNGELDCSFQGDPVWLTDTISFQHILNPVDNTLTVELTYQGTAWVGFGVSAAGQMVGSEVIIAKPEEAPSSSNPGKYSITARQQDAIQLSDRQTLANAAFEQSGGTTVLRFTKALAETGEIPISADSSNTFVFAAGSTNTFGYHAQRGSITIPLLTRCVAAARDTPIPTTAPSVLTPSTSSPTAGTACLEESGALRTCVTATGDAAGCVACLETQAGSSTATTCDEVQAEMCGIGAACPDCGTCQSEMLALLNCLNDDLCGTIECVPTTPTPTSSPPSAPSSPIVPTSSAAPALTPAGASSPAVSPSASPTVSNPATPPAVPSPPVGENSTTAPTTNPSGAGGASSAAELRHSATAFPAVVAVTVVAATFGLL